MNFNKVKDFFKTPLGGLVLLLLVVLIAYLFIQQRQPAQVPTTATSTSTAPTASVTHFENDIPEVRPAPSAPLKPTLIYSTEKQEAITTLPIDLYTSKEEATGSVFAPFGRLIRCSLVNTVDSSKIQTPIIGIVTDDVLNPGGDGEIVVPAGTEVHGMAQVDHSRERIGTQGNWTLVWTDGTGRELPLSGIGCDMDKDPKTDSWSIPDGSAGLRGYIIKSDNWAEVKLFAATALQGLAQGLSNTQTTTNGLGGITTSSIGSLQNGGLMGAQAVMQQYAQQVLEQIRQNGFYVRVPAGTTFYVYVTQTIDQSAAVIAGSKISQTHTTPIQK